MPPTHPFPKPARGPLALALAAGTLVGAAILPGCADTDPEPGAMMATPKVSAQGLTAADFVAPAGAVGPADRTAHTEPALPVPPAPEQVAPVRMADTSIKMIPAPAPGEGADGIAVITGEPPRGVVRDTARPIDQPAYVDVLVGQTNGRPIYASSFLAELEPQLKRMAADALRQPTAKKAKEEWEVNAAGLIADTARRDLQGDLFLAEARSALTPEQRQGLVFFVNRLRENIASDFQGSEILADEEARKQGITLEGKVERKQQDALIGNLLGKYLEPRINPSFRDVQRAYELNRAAYNPPPVAHLRVITIPNDGYHDADITTVYEALAAGRPFADVASMPINTYGEPGKSGKVADKELTRPYAETELFVTPEWNKAAHGLKPGETVGPFDSETRAAGGDTGGLLTTGGLRPRPSQTMRQKVWVHLESITQEPCRPLEDVQLEILKQLRSQKWSTEFNRLKTRLLASASISSRAKMIEDLVIIASERYFHPPVPYAPAAPTVGAAAPPAPAPVTASAPADPTK